MIRAGAAMQVKGYERDSAGGQGVDAERAEPQQNRFNAGALASGVGPRFYDLEPILQEPDL